MGAAETVNARPEDVHWVKGRKAQKLSIAEKSRHKRRWNLFAVMRACPSLIGLRAESGAS